MNPKLFLSASTLLLSAIATSTVTVAHEYPQGDPANPQAFVPAAHYHAIITDYRATPIMTTPGNWRELNDRAEKIGGPRGQLREVTEPIRPRKKR